MSALERKHWKEAIRHLSAIHSRGLGDNDSHYRCGWALVMVERWSEAISEFEQIDGALSKPSTQAYCIFNHCLALAHVGRFDEAKAMLGACGPGTWPPHIQESVRQLKQYVQRQSEDPPQPIH